MAAHQWYETPRDPAAEHEAAAQRIDRLLDAIELVKANRHKEAQPILRSLIQENSDFEDAWLWMSVVVDSIDQAVLCLDNALRINPDNVNAATALYRLRMVEFASQQKRARLRAYRDMSLFALWMLIMGLLFAILLSSSVGLVAAPA